jgi:hypothetical protein
LHILIRCAFALAVVALVFSAALNTHMPTGTHPAQTIYEEN